MYIRKIEELYELNFYDFKFEINCKIFQNNNIHQ